MLRKHIALATCILILNVNLYGQTNFGTTGNVNTNPVNNNLFNGTASINIPLVNKSIDGIDLGVNLNYTTSGIKLNQISTNVGLGWNLSTGGGITRVVKGLPDEFNVNGNNSFHGFCVGYWHRTNLNIPFEPQGITKSIADVEVVNKIAKGIADGQMDEFSMSMCGMQVDFIINAQNEIKTIPENTGIKIERMIGSNVVGVFPKGEALEEIGFKVTDVAGNKYFLKSGSKSKIIPLNYSTGSPLPDGLYSGAPPLTKYYTNNWVIDYIETYSGKKIQFYYTPEYNFEYISDRIEQMADIGQSDLNCYQISQGITTSGQTVTLNDIITSEKLKDIDNIDFPDINIKFSYSAAVRQDIPGNHHYLEQIEVNEKNNFSIWSNSTSSTINLLSKRIKFSQSYFDSYEVPSILDEPFRRRLRLDKIQTVLPNNLTKDLYSFDYYDIKLSATQPNPENDIVLQASSDLRKWPSRLNSCQDYWGYYNGNSQSATTANGDAFYIPELMILTPNGGYGGGTNREANNNNRLYSLRKIKNQQGGVTKFIYGLNEASVNGSMMKLDGVRLEEVWNYTEGMEHNGTKDITKYEYENGEWLIPNTTIPNIKDLFRSKFNLTCKHYMNGTLMSSTTTNNIDLYNNRFLGQISGSEHGYGLVKSIYKKDIVNKTAGVSTTETEPLGSTWTYFSTIKNVSTSNFTLLGSQLAGGAYNLPSNNLILPAPIISSTIPGISSLSQNVNYFMSFDKFPYTYKTYSNHLAMGVPYKTIEYDRNNFKKSESEQKYKVYVKALNTDNFLNLNASLKNRIVTTQSTLTYTPPGTSLDDIDPYLDYYYPFQSYIELVENKAKTYINNTQSIQKNKTYFYDPITKLPFKTSEIAEDGSIIENIDKFNMDDNNWNSNPVMLSLSNANIQKRIYSEVWKKKPGGQFVLKNSSGGGYVISGNKVQNKYSYSLKENTTLLTASTFPLANANQGNEITNFRKGAEVTYYDELGNSCETLYKGIYNSNLYDFYQDAIVASVTNSKFSEIAYQSFESNIYDDNDGTPTYEKDKGNWMFHTSGIHFTDGITGHRSYNLNSSNASGNNEIISAPIVQLQNGKKYIISFWKKGAGSVALENWNTYNGTLGTFTSTAPITVESFTVNTSNIPRLNGWTYCQAEFIATYERLKISGACLIDELRLYPADATMTTTCFSPLVGKISTCDAGNNIIHFEKDLNNNIEITRDSKGNILSKTKSINQEND